MRIFTFLFSVGLSFILSACGMDKKPIVDKIVVLGDPMNVIADTAQNPRVDFNYFRGIEKVYLIGGVNFEEKRRLSAERRVVQVLDEDLIPNEMFMVEIKNGELAMATAKLSMAFKDTADSTRMVIGAGSNFALARLEHFSVSNDGNLFSILFSIDVGGDTGRMLMSRTFARKWQPKPYEKTRERFAYTLGDGVKMGWRKNSAVNVDICGPFDLDEKDSVTDAIKEWSRALPDTLVINRRMARTYPPFSDLNQHCIYKVNNYFTYARMNRANYGITYSIVDMNYPAIVDSDIFIVAKEFTKGYLTPDEYEHNFNFTILHELGHFLGLDHKFDGTESIMSYNFDLWPTLYPYDEEAISELYR